MAGSGSKSVSAETTYGIGADLRVRGTMSSEGAAVVKVRASALTHGYTKYACMQSGRQKKKTLELTWASTHAH
jgi:hypothetical protein